MITARKELLDHLIPLVGKDEAEIMIEEYKDEIIADLYKVYKIESNSCYIGTSLVAAKTVNEANYYINIFRELDKDNTSDSYGYSTVTEDDVIEKIYSSESGIIDYGIHYYG